MEYPDEDRDRYRDDPDDVSEDQNLSEDDYDDSRYNRSRDFRNPSRNQSEYEDEKERENDSEFDRENDDDQYDKNYSQDPKSIVNRPPNNQRYDDDEEDEDDKYEDEDDDQLRVPNNQEDNKQHDEEDKKEDDKQDEEQEQPELAPLINKHIVYSRERSHVLPIHERAVLESEVLRIPEKSELIMSSNKNSQNEAEDKNKPSVLDSEKLILSKLEKDGIYRIGVAAENLVTETLTRPIDLSLRQVFRTKIRSAIVSERINSIKKKHYKLELILGKIVLRDHPYFNAEDIKAIEVTELHEEFERVAGLGMVPFYQNRIVSLKEELNRTEKAKKIDEDHIRFLKASLKDVRK